MKFSVVIPTYNRERDLKSCLDSILNQNVLPSELLIVDDGKLSNEFLASEKKSFAAKKVNLVYNQKDHASHRKGLSESKNLALNLAVEKIVFFLDDDLILNPGFFDNIMKIWESNYDDKLIGVGGVITNNRKKNVLEKIYDKIFCLSSTAQWDVNDLGFQAWNDFLIRPESGFYAHGGVCSYQVSAVLKLGGFKTFRGGRTALEDVDLALRAKNNGYYFVVNPQAGVVHMSSRQSKETTFAMGVKESLNRKEIFRSNCKQNPKNKFLFIWANLGWILRQFLAVHIFKGLGMLCGFLRIRGL